MSFASSPKVLALALPILEKLRLLNPNVQELFYSTPTPDKTARKIREAINYAKRNNIPEYGDLLNGFIVRATPTGVRIQRRFIGVEVPDMARFVDVSQETTETIQQTAPVSTSIQTQELIRAPHTTTTQVSSLTEIIVHVTQRMDKTDLFLFEYTADDFSEHLHEKLERWCDKMGLVCDMQLTNITPVRINPIITIQKNDPR